MTKTELAQQILELPVEDQLELAHQVLMLNAPEPDFEISPALRQTLRARLADAKANPETGVPWEEVKESILKRL